MLRGRRQSDETTAGGTRTSGTVASFRNRGNETIAFGYDALGRRTSKDLPGSEPDVAYSYDLLGRLTGASRTGYSLAFTYDALGRKLTETGPLGTIGSTWDSAGRRTRLTWPGGAWYVDYDYLVTGEMTAIRENGATSGAGVLAAFAYDGLGRRTSLTRGNGVATSYTYTGPLLTGLGLDLAGTTQDLSVTMGYNKAMQIVSRTASNDSYSWTGHGSGTSAIGVDGLNRPTAIGTSTETYDSKGNVASHNHWGVRTFSWTSENRLAGTTVASPASSWTFGYDTISADFGVCG